MLKALRTPTTLLNSQLLASRTPSSSLALRVGAHAARSYATETPLPSTSSADPVGKNGKDGEPSGVLRPHLGVEVNPNHGLWAFFRKAVGKDGAVTYETLEAKDDTVDYSGRAWSAAEIRRKSFKDLHTLWYVVLRERNLLETQFLEAKRLGALKDMTPIKKHILRCRKTMARIKYVINERRLAYEGAVQIIAENKEREVLSRRELTAQRKAAWSKKHETVAPQPEVTKVEEPHTAAERAAAGLLQPSSVER